ncbi:GPI anchored protein [Purpureocillium lavendulum]|uniref:GPI anchored protein n=1 Tax=Purpureocillium lavendulum TaxID=1247861 RepID=A0AB34FZM9_9HYPO|nr:GPI anchored protein [Purpureocillium lavendulum]
MRTMKVLALVALGGLATAHFQLKYPKSIGFSDDDEDKAPCGGFTPDFSKDVVDFHVGGEALAMRLTHQQCNWLFRATTDQKAESGWEQLFPIVMQSGLGDFCEPAITAPESFVGKKGVVSVVSSAPDGLLYQCVAVNFVSGSAKAPSQCTNATVKASFVDDAKLSALVGSSANTSSGGSSATPTKSSAAATSTGAAPSVQMRAGSGFSWAGAVTVLAMAALGGAFMA